MFEALLAICLSTSLVSIWLLYLPIHRLAQSNANSIYVKKPILTFVVFFIMATIFAPMIFGAMMHDRHRETFIQEMGKHH